MVKPDGSVWTWSLLSDDPWYEEDQVVGLSSTIKVSGSNGNYIALKDDGTVRAFDQSGAVSAIGGLAGITDISASGYHCLAIDMNQNLWSWGDNTYGQLGDGTTASSSVPVLVSDSQLPSPSISFNGAGYSMAIPDSGTSTIGMTATAYDPAGQPVSNAAISYSLVAPYTGVSVNSSTGLVTVSPTAQPGSVTVKAEYQGLSAAAKLTLTATVPPVQPGTEIELTVTQNSEYLITLNANDIATFSGKPITVTYAPAELQLINAAEQVYGSYTATGAIPGAGITITNAAPGILELEFSAAIPQGKTWSGVITVLKFKALASGTTTISVA